MGVLIFLKRGICWEPTIHTVQLRRFGICELRLDSAKVTPKQLSRNAPLAEHDVYAALIRVANMVPVDLQLGHGPSVAPIYPDFQVIMGLREVTAWIYARHLILRHTIVVILPDLHFP